MYFHIKLVEEKDTANVAKNISNTKTMGIGAIASKLAAKIYDLNLIKEDFLTQTMLSVHAIVFEGFYNK